MIEYDQKVDFKLCWALLKLLQVYNLYNHLLFRGIGAASFLEKILKDIFIEAHNDESRKTIE